MNRIYQCIFKRLIVILITVFHFCTFIPAHAEGDINVFRTWEGWEHDQTVMNSGDMSYLKWATTCFFQIAYADNGYNFQWAYCLNPDKPSETRGYSSRSFKDWDGMSDSLKKQVNAIAYFGYLYPGHEDVRWHAATQTAIWRAVTGKYFPSRYNPDDNRPENDPLTSYDNVKGLEDEIFKMVDAYKNLSFSCEVYHEDGSKAAYKDGKWEIQANETARVHVTSANLNMMDIVKLPSGVSICDKNGKKAELSSFDERNSGNDFYIKAEANASGTVSVKAPGLERDETHQQVVFVQEGAQDMMTRASLMDIKSFSFGISAKEIPLYFEKRDALTGKRIADAKITFYNSSWKKTETITTAKDKPVKLNASLYSQKEKYYVVEENVPEGYEAEKIDVKQPETVKGVVIAQISFDMEANYDEGKAILAYAENQPVSDIRIIKKDEEGNILPGCHLQICDDNNRILDEFDTNDEPYLFRVPFQPDQKFIIHETSAPAGYYLAEDVSIQLDHEFTPGKIYEVQMQDGTIEAWVEKVNRKGKPVKNAALRLVDQTDGKDILTWISDGTRKEIGQYLVAGHNYTIVEDDMSLQFYLANDDIFDVPLHDAGTIERTIVDDFIQYEFAKVDENGNPVPGALLLIYDVTDETGPGKDIPVLKFESQNEPEQTLLLQRGHTYWLVEVAPPQHYRPVVDNQEYRLSDIAALVSGNKAVYKEFTVPERTSDGGKYVTVTFTNKRIVYHVSKKDHEGKPVSGADLQIVDITDPKEEIVIDQWTTDGTVRDIYTLSANHKYRLEEIAPPDGYYVCSNNEFTVGEYDEKEVTLTMIDDQTDVSVYKVDENGKMLEGISLSILYDGKPVYSFVSKAEPEHIRGILEAGKTYTLHEDKPRKGFYQAEDVSFEIPRINPGKPIEVKMVDPSIKIKVRKVDESKKPLEGAKLILLDEENQIAAETETVVEDWDISTYVEAGKTYTLHEEEYVKGHYIAKDETFTVDLYDPKEVIIKEMVDETICLKARKVDESGQMLEGAVITLTDQETGEVVDEWTSILEDHDLSEVVVPGHSYTMQEKEIVDGHYIAKDVVFTVDQYTQEEDIIIQDMIDQTTRLLLKKIDDKTGEIVEGVVLKLWDETDPQNPVEISPQEGWTTTRAPIELRGIVTGGHQYRLEESEYVAGVYKATDIVFQMPMEAGDEPITITMMDETTNTGVRKIASSGKYLEGAVLQILDQENNVVYEWTAKAETEDISAHVKGNETYTLHEKEAPFGYACAKDIVFRIEGKKNNPQSILMIDEPQNIYVRLEKRSTASGRGLAGAQLTVYKDGEIAEDIFGKKAVYTTDAEGAAFAVLPFCEEGYTVKETKAPDGYHLNPSVFPVELKTNYTFTEQDQIVVTIYDEAKVPDTGIRRSFYFWIVLTAFLCGAFCIVNKK